MKLKSILTVIASAAMAVCGSAAKAGDLPAEYTAVEYIESTGTQYIDTKVNASKTLVAEMDYLPKEYTGDVNLGDTSSDGADWRFFTYSGGPLFDWGSARVGQTSGNALTLDVRYLVNIGAMDGTVYLAVTNAETMAEVKNFTANCAGSPAAKPICVFGGNTSGTMKYTKMRLYSLKLWDYLNEGDAERTLLRDFVPCKNSLGEAGLYDFASESFFPNGGSGNFLFPAEGVTMEAALVTACGPDKELYFKDRNVADIVDLSIEGYQKFGGSVDTREYTWSAGPITGSFADSGLYLYHNDGTTLTIEFHGSTYGHSYDGVGSGFKLQLTQEESDIYGQVLWYVGSTGSYGWGYDVTWEGHEKSNWNDWDNDALYSVGGHNLKAAFTSKRGEAHIVRFVDKDNNLIEAKTVPAGETTVTAPTPTVFEGFVFVKWDRDFSFVNADMTVKALYHKLCTVRFLGMDNEPFATQLVEETKDAEVPQTIPEPQGYVFYAWDKAFTKISKDTDVKALYHKLYTVRFLGMDGEPFETQTVEETKDAKAPQTIPVPEGYVFYAWDKAFTGIFDDTDVTALYHQLFSVTFVDGDGITILKEQIVEETHDAVAPDMVGREYDGGEFLNWDTDFTNVQEDLTVKAIYGERPVSLVDGVFGYAGLLQGKLNVANDFTTDFIANSVIPVEIVPGTLMADVKVGSDAAAATTGRVNPYTGTTFYWNSQNTTFGYLGKIWLNAGDTINIAKNIDDTGFVKIDGNEVLKDTGWGNYPVKSYTATFTGWHDFEARVADGNGGKGPASGKISPLGLAYNINGTTTQSAEGWSPFYDETGTFLATPFGETGSCLLQGATKNDGGTITTKLGAQGLPFAAKLMAFYGTTDGGKNPSAWQHSILLNTYAAGDTAAKDYVIPGLGNNAAVRFALVADSVTPPASQFTPLRSYVQRQPLATISIGEIGADNTNKVPVCVNVEALGADATALTVVFQYSASPTFDDAQTFDVEGSLTEVGEAALTLSGLSAAMGYYVRAVVSNGTASFTTEAKYVETYDPYAAHAGDTVIWAGGAIGTWDATTKNWLLDVDGGLHNVAWADGCTAVFPEAVEVTVVGAKQVMGFDFGGDAVLQGDAIDIAAPATLNYSGNAQVLFRCDVSGTAGLKISRTETLFSVDGIAEGENCVCPHKEEGEYKSATDIHHEELPLPTSEAAEVPGFWIRGVRLADVSDIRATFHGIFGGAQKRSDVSLANKKNDAGVYFYQNDGQVLTAQFQQNTYAGYCFCIKIKLEQKGNDVYGHTVYVRYGDEKSPRVGGDWDEYKGRGWEAHLYNLRLVLMPTTPSVTFDGAYTVSGDHDLAIGTFTFGENATFGSKLDAKFKLYDDDLVFANKTEGEVQIGVSMKEAKSKGVVNVLPGVKNIYKGNKGGDYVLNVYGELSTSDDYNYTTLPQGKGSLGIYGTYVYPGAALSIGHGYYNIGLNGDAPIYVYTNAVLRLINTTGNSGYTALGTGKSARLIGGVVTNATEKDQMIHNVYLSNGAKAVGGQMSVGGNNGGYAPDGNGWAKIEAGGETPSFFATDILRIGFSIGGYAKATATRAVGAKLIVADVTGGGTSDGTVPADDKTDFYISSTIVDRDLSNVAYYDDLEGQIRRGLWKQGPGTVELTGANCNAPAGVFKMEEGTVRLGKGASGKLGALMVVGNSTIDCAGGTMEFADASQIPWTDGAKLNLTGDISALRFGTDANGLTAAQLAAITVNGKPSKLRLTDDGHLKKPGFQMIIR